MRLQVLKAATIKITLIVNIMNLIACGTTQDAEDCDIHW